MVHIEANYGTRIATAVLGLLRTYAEVKGLSGSYASRILTGSGQTLKRLEGGGSLTPARAARIVATASHHWPMGVDWPAGISRPESQITHSEVPVSDLVAAARAARDRMVDATDPQTRHEAAAEARAIGARLDPETGQVASPAALCAALGCSRKIYENTVTRYADGRRRKPPRRGSKTARMLAALRWARDARFKEAS